MSELNRYLVGRIQQALAEDERTATLDLRVKITAGQVFLMGTVDSAERRQAAEQVAREIVPGDMSVVNDLWLANYRTPPEPETVP